MDNSNVKKWIAALRSGDYAQTKGSLSREEDGEKKYCCLGVLCEVYQKEEGDVSYNGNDSLPPPRIIMWADPKDKIQVTDLVDMNDRDSRSFDEIADHIENAVR